MQQTALLRYKDAQNAGSQCTVMTWPGRKGGHQGRAILRSPCATLISANQHTCWLECGTGYADHNMVFMTAIHGLVDLNMLALRS
jgi:hypothetical protein